MQYAYRRNGEQGFDETVAAVERAVRLHGLVVSGVHDLHRTLAAKGFPISPLRIYEVCTGDDYWKTTPPGLDLVLPCRVSVSVEDGEVVVAAIRPSLAARVFPEAHLEVIAGRIEESVLRVVDEAVSV